MNILDASAFLDEVSKIIGTIKDAKEIIGMVSVGVAWLFRKGFPSAVHVHPVSTTQAHDAMWNWDNRMFRFRHPQRYSSFDIVSLELGRDWWRRYPESDWIVCDWKGLQIGQYALCPLKELAYNKLLSGSILESNLVPDDVEPVTDIHAHTYWYLANFMVAKRQPKIPDTMSELVRNLMILHAVKRALKNKHFATAFNREIVVVTIAEAPSIYSMARKNGFNPAHPGSNDTHLSKIYFRRYDVQQLKAIKAQLTKPVRTGKLSSLYIRFKYKNLFLQPPSYT